jgi:SAM-dependent methyltransferase
MGPERSLEWIHSFGVCSIPELRRHFPEVPPEELRRITGSPVAEQFLLTGLRDAGRLVGAFVRHRRSGAGTPRVLDFACGCGRIARFTWQWTRDLRVAEINPQLLEFCRSSLDGVAAIETTSVPPIDLGDGSLDFVYGYSVFTHTVEEATLAWLREFSRLLAPGGILVFTTNGYVTLDALTDYPHLRQWFHLDPVEQVAFREALDTDGIASRPYESRGPGFDYGEGYGLVFVSLDHIAREWVVEGFELVEQEPGSPSGLQDLTVLRRQ